jgi:hypothetical protein
VDTWLGFHDRFQTAVEKVFFKQKSTRKSVYVTFVIGNVVLMVVLFYKKPSRIPGALAAG